MYIGQFLVELNFFFSWFNIAGIYASCIMVFTLFIIRSNYLVKLNPSVNTNKFFLGLLIGGLVSVLTAIILTTTSYMLFSTVLEVTECTLDKERASISGVEQNPKQLNNLNTNPHYTSGQDINYKYNTVKVTGKVISNKYGRIITFVGIIFLIVGGGYAFTTINLGFWGSFGAMSVGIGIPEEYTKGLAGLLILYLIFENDSLSEGQFKKTLLAAFGIAGLGFGALEALKYFGLYAKNNLEFDWYLLRATWCVTLHGAWAVITGALIITLLPKDPKLIKEKKGEIFGCLLLASIPTAIAHGLYNTTCFEIKSPSGFFGGFGLIPLLVGILSISTAIIVIETSLDDKNGELKPEQSFT